MSEITSETSQIAEMEAKKTSFNDYQSIRDEYKINVGDFKTPKDFFGHNFEVLKNMTESLRKIERQYSLNETGLQPQVRNKLSGTLELLVIPQKMSNDEVNQWYKLMQMWIQALSDWRTDLERQLNIEHPDLNI